MRCFLLALLLPALAAAAPADLDPRFGLMGQRQGDYAGPTQQQLGMRAFAAVGSGYAALVERETPEGRRLALIRLDARGIETGASVLPHDPVHVNEAHVYPDGRVLLVGVELADLDTAEVRVERRLPDGALDATFGGGDGRVALKEDGLGLIPTALDVTAAGDIAIAGHLRVLEAPDATAVTFVARLNASGQPVSVFDVDGIGSADVIPNGSDFPEAVALLPGGQVLVCDTGSFGGQLDALLTRFRSTGVVDAYGSSGTLFYDTTPPAQPNVSDYCEDVDVNPANGATVMTVRRSNGAMRGVRRVPVDNAGNAGLAFDNVATAGVPDAELEFDALGRAVLMVTSVSQASIDVDFVRFLPNGTGDLAFGVGGVVRHAVPRPTGSVLASVSLDTPLVLHDGRGRIVAGASLRDHEEDQTGWVMLRLMGDAGFGDGFE